MTRSSLPGSATAYHTSSDEDDDASPSSSKPRGNWAVFAGPLGLLDKGVPTMHEVQVGVPFYHGRLGPQARGIVAEQNQGFP